MSKLYFYILFWVGLVVLLAGFILGLYPSVTHEFALRVMWLGIGLMVASLPAFIAVNILMNASFNGQALVPHRTESDAGEPGDEGMAGGSEDEEEEGGGGDDKKPPPGWDPSWGDPPST